uniref:KIB1-4 beta-propeller domain-containing protein n=1 Tax=Arundo donax TaxID=35708 RepID=A0A0A8XUD0_ARUDO
MKMPIRNETSKVTPTGKNKFEMFKADFQQSKWTKVTTIGEDQVLFLRKRCSRLVCVSQNEMPGDRIVFLEKDNEDHDWFDEESLNVCCVYDMRDGKVSTSVPMVSWKLNSVPATWLFPPRLK